ncbi:MAG: metallophosphoesterase [Opitutae bacterium]
MNPFPAPLPELSRRNFLKNTGALILGTSLGGAPASLTAAPPTPGRKRLLRVAHLTDIHVSDIKGAAEGMAAAIRHAQAQSDRPDLLLFGGDCIGDALEQPKEKVLPQWELWNRIFAAEVKLPHAVCLGNHDILGWSRRGDLALAQDPDYGKALALRRLGLAQRYFSFDRSGWHFVVLDSMQMGRTNGYFAQLDEEQFAWLGRDLAATPAATPVCVLSHIPILSAAAFLDGDLAKTGNWEVPGAWMHLDARRIKDLFLRHANVRICLSGHLHMVDDVSYLGVRYLCNGAVCGGWWKGNYQEFGPAYALLDLYDDGSAENQLVAYLS